MNNAELIKELRECGNEPYDITKPCKVSPWKLMRDAADALEAADKRIAELSLDCERFQQKCMELDAQMKTVTDYHASGEGER